MADLDLAGIITRACANLRLRFSKVAVSRTLTSGTKSATVTVDGVKYNLYAPTPPTASTAAPLMDGTASYGSGTSYARSNHRHPTDTSRQETLVSGTNIKTINGESLLGSGDLTIGGGGGTSYRIVVTVINGSITAVDYGGATLTEIAAAYMDDPTIDLRVIITDNSYNNRQLLVSEANYSAPHGDISAMLRCFGFWYDDGDDDYYIINLQLAGYGNSYSDARI